jgi:sugar lactone lactonase YvrE
VLTTALYDSYSLAFSTNGDIFVACYQTPTSYYNTNTAADGGIFKIDQFSLAITPVAVTTSFVSDYSTNLVTPFGLAAEPGGNFLVADLDAYTNLDVHFTDGTVAGGAVFRLDPDTGVLTVLSTNGPSTGANFNFLGGIAVGTNGGTESIFVTDQGDGVTAPSLIQIDPATGTQTVLFSGLPLVSPDGLAVDFNGSAVTNIVVADSSAQALIQISTNSVDGAWIATAVPVTGGSFAHPTHVAIDPLSGDFLVTDGEPATLANENAGALWRVIRHSFLMVSESSGGFMEQPRGLIIQP